MLYNPPPPSISISPSSPFTVPSLSSTHRQSPPSISFLIITGDGEKNHFFAVPGKKIAFFFLKSKVNIYIGWQYISWHFPDLLVIILPDFCEIYFAGGFENLYSDRNTDNITNHRQLIELFQVILEFLSNSRCNILNLFGKKKKNLTVFVFLVKFCHQIMFFKLIYVEYQVLSNRIN